METKLSKIRALYAAGEYRAALKIAAGFAQLGEQKERIERAWAASCNPDFYRQIGKDPEELFNDGVLAMRERWDLNYGDVCDD